MSVNPRPFEKLPSTWQKNLPKKVEASKAKVPVGYAVISRMGRNGGSAWFERVILRTLPK